MSHRTTRRIAVLAAVLSTIAVLALAAPRSSAATSAATPGATSSGLALAKAADPGRSTPAGIAGSFLGKVAGTDIAVAVVVRADRQAIVYLCDAQGVSQWFRGRATATALHLTAGTARIDVTLTRSKATGSFSLGDGVVRRFTATGAAKGSGLWRAAGTAGGADLVVGWIVLDGKLNGFGLGFGGASCGFGFQAGLQQGFGGGGCGFGGGFGGSGGGFCQLTCGGFGAVNGAPDFHEGDPPPELLVQNGTLAARVTIAGETATLVGAPLGSRSVLP